MSAEFELAKYLATQGHGTYATDLFEQAVPDTVTGLAIVVRATGGAASEKAMGGVVAIEQPDFQIQVRAAKDAAAAGRTKIENIKNDLDNVSFTSEGVLFHWCEVQGNITQLSPDENGRYRWVVNVRAKKDRS